MHDQIKRILDNPPKAVPAEEFVNMLKHANGWLRWSLEFEQNPNSFEQDRIEDAKTVRDILQFTLDRFDGYKQKIQEKRLLTVEEMNLLDDLDFLIGLNARKAAAIVKALKCAKTMEAQLI